MTQITQDMLTPGRLFRARDQGGNVFDADRISQKVPPGAVMQVISVKRAYDMSFWVEAHCFATRARGEVEMLANLDNDWEWELVE